MAKIKLSDLMDLTGVKITQAFGVPWVKDKSLTHDGVDFSVPKFTALNCPIDAVLTRASYHFSTPQFAFGNRVSIRIDNEHEIYFCHLDGFDLRLREYKPVKKGWLLGRVGSSGSSTGVHLHLGVRLMKLNEKGNVTWLDPALFFDYCGVT